MAIARLYDFKFSWSPRKTNLIQAGLVDLWTPNPPQREHCHSSILAGVSNRSWTWCTHLFPTTDRQHGVLIPSSSVGRSGGRIQSCASFHCYIWHVKQNRGDTSAIGLLINVMFSVLAKSWRPRVGPSESNQNTPPNSLEASTASSSAAATALKLC